MKLFDKKKIRLYLIAGLIITGALYLMFNNNGIFKYVRTKGDLEKLNSRIIQLESENRKLEAEIDSLRKAVPAKIEKVAREKYNMIRADEKKVEFKIDE